MDSEPVVSQNHYGLRLDVDLSSSGVPEQITNETGASHESIYQHYVYKDKMRHGELYFNLRQDKKRRQQHINKNIRRRLIPYAVSIDKRPKIVDNRTRFDDFEVDTVIGANHKQVLVAILERKSSLMFIKKVPNRIVELVSKSDSGVTFTDKIKCKNNYF